MHSQKRFSLWQTSGLCPRTQLGKVPQTTRLYGSTCVNPAKHVTGYSVTVYLIFKATEE